MAHHYICYNNKTQNVEFIGTIKQFNDQYLLNFTEQTFFDWMKGNGLTVYQKLDI